MQNAQSGGWRSLQLGGRLKKHRRDEELACEERVDGTMRTGLCGRTRETHAAVAIT
jgi:hypothetical protein